MRSSSCAVPGSRPPKSAGRRDADLRGGPPSRAPRGRASVPGESRRRCPKPAPAPRSVAPVPLLQPRVAAKVVAVRLPEAGLVLVPELEAAHPLGALPEVEVRDEQPYRAAVLRVERLAVVAERDPGFAVDQILERDVRRVAAVTERDRVGRVVLDGLEQRVDSHALPDRVELRPAGDAVDVGGDRLARESLELVPRPADRLAAAAELERPLLERRVRRRARREHREVVGQVLARRYPVRRPISPLALEPSRNDPHRRNLLSLRRGPPPWPARPRTRRLPSAHRRLRSSSRT